MSRSIKQAVWGAAILAISLVFIMQFRPGAQLQGMGADAGAEPTCAVEVERRCIVTQSDFVTAFRLVASGNLEDDSRREMVRQLVLEGLIQRWLLVEDAFRLGIAVSEDDVTRGLSRGFVRVSLPADHEDDMLAYQLGLSQPDGAARAIAVKDPKSEKFDYERYKKWVQRVSGKTLKDFREFASNEELAARMRALIRSRVRVAEADARAEFAVSSAKLVADYIPLSRDFYQRRADASNDAVTKWATENAKELDEAFATRKEEFAPSCRKARHLLVRVDDSGDKAAATKKAREKIDAAKKRIEKGDDFADVARTLSEDAQSASVGGALGCFAAGKLARPNTARAVDDAAFAVEKGKLSEVVESTFGLHLVTVDAILDGEAAEKEGRSQIARERYLKAEGERLAASAAKEIATAVKGGKTLAQALDEHLSGLTPKVDADAEADRPQLTTSSEFSLAGPPFPGVENPLAAAGALFALEVGGVPADPIKTYTGYAVAQVKEKKALDEKDWLDKRETLLDSLRRDRERDALVRYLHTLREKYAKSITYTTKDEGKKKSGKGEAPKGQEPPASPAEPPGGP
ncbi:MAG: peptidylprolyl isomerase [Deltaproteobacteria bacterium]|nr:peptidylprolyl isomerase [Deltaproteobacteria bacterium]